MIKDIVIIFTLLHVKILDFIESPKPSLWELFKAIERSSQFIYQISLPLSNKSCWLLYVNFFFKITMQESIFNVY